MVWFRHDLRLADNPALSAACATGQQVVCLYVFDEDTPGNHAMGGASRWWLFHSLRALQSDVRRLGGQLILRRGPCAKMVAETVAQLKCGEVHWNRRYDKAGIAADTEIKSALEADGVRAVSHKANVLFEPWEVKNGSGEPYRVFTPFWRAARALGIDTQVLSAPPRLNDGARSDGKGPVSSDVSSDLLDDWDLLPSRPDWSCGFSPVWTPGEAGAQRRLQQFLGTGLSGYGHDRDIPSVEGTSRLSPHLAFGEISPRQIAAQTLAHAAAIGEDPGMDSSPDAGVDKFLAEIGWREFSHSLIYHNPDFPTQNFQPKFDHFPWANDDAALTAWQRGQTGYPIVDAGMRQLWATGWMHNRVRMIVGSFLVKHLLLDWCHGERWFWDTLVDADIANNAAGWQWIGGCGADAAPYFRIFNPITQGEKFDPDGIYVRRWVPELKKLSKRFIHKPWTASPVELASAGVTLGRTYPQPIVDHASARARALAAFETLKAPA